MLLRSWTRGTRPWSSSLRQSTSKSFPEEHSDRPVAENVDWSFLLILLPVVAASPPRRRPCLSLPRVVVVPASCRVAPASSPPSILTFILTSILTSVLTLSSPRRRLVASSSPSSLRRRVAVELSCHSAVVAAVFPASSPPRRLVSAPSSFHRAVIGPSRRSSVRLGAPSSSPRRLWCIPLHRRRRSSRRHPSVPAYRRRRPSRHRHPFGDGAAQRSTVIAAAVIAPQFGESSDQSSSSPPSSSSHRRRPASRVARQHAGPSEPPPSEPSPSFPRRGLALGQHLQHGSG